jgi:ribonuclease HI
MTHVFTDGSAFGNGKTLSVGGIGVFFDDNSPYNISKGFMGSKTLKVTNQSMELTAMVSALESIIENNLAKPVTVYSDSMYSIDCVTKWWKGWEKNGYMTKFKKPVLNKDLIKRLVRLNHQVDASYVHVPAHKLAPFRSDPNYALWYGNHEADRLATEAAKRMAKQKNQKGGASVLKMLGATGNLLKNGTVLTFN